MSFGFIKKQIVVTAILLCLVCLFGCSGNDAEGIESNIPPDVKLTVYTNIKGDETNNPFSGGILKMYDRFSYSDVHVVFFAPENTDDMLVQIVRENEEGRGPDLVVLGSSEEGIPGLLQLVSSGILTDISHYISRDTRFIPSEIDENAFSAGKVGGKLLFVPDSVSLKCLLTTEKRLSDNGIDPLFNHRGTLQGYDSWLKSAVQRRAAENAWVLGPDVTPSSLLAASGIYLADPTDFSYAADRNLLREIIGYTASLFSGMPLSSESADGAYAKSFYLSGYTLFLPMRYLGVPAASASSAQIYMEFLTAAAAGETMPQIRLFPLPSIDGMGHASVNRLYGICSGSKNKDAAWLFTRYMLDRDGQSAAEGFLDSIPVRISTREDLVRSLTEAKAYIRQGAAEASGMPIDEGFIDSYITAGQNLQSCSAHDATVMAIYNRAVYRYSSGEIDMDSCLDEIEREVSSYLESLR